RRHGLGVGFRCGSGTARLSGRPELEHGLCGSMGQRAAPRRGTSTAPLPGGDLGIAPSIAGDYHSGNRGSLTIAGSSVCAAWASLTPVVGASNSLIDRLLQ